MRSSFLLCITIALCVLIFSGCKGNSPVNPVEANEKLTSGYAVFYGNYYDYLGISENVLGLSLMSEHLSVDDSTGYYVGNGTNLIMTDIFVDKADTLLPSGHYTISDKGLAMTFVDGHDYEGNLVGSYMLLVSESGYKAEVLTKGSFDVDYSGDTTIINFQFSRANGRTYSPSFRGILPTYISSDVVGN